MLTVVPVLVVATGLYVYLHSGRYIETDNAYIKANRVMISAEISGVIARIAVADNQAVAAGETLFELENRPYQIALNRAAAGLAPVSLDIAADQLAYEEAQAEVDLQRSNVTYFQSRLLRQRELRRNNLGTLENLDSAIHEYDRASKQVVLMQQKAARLLASLGGRPDMPVAEHPRHLTAQAVLDEAELNMTRTRIFAPFAGIATNVPKLGDYITPGRPVMAVVANTDMWVEANFKETDLMHIKPGQPVIISGDTYTDRKWRGRVQSIAEATGAEFALLPPQNATGNWVKIVQRIPLKIVLDPQADAPILRMGMSTTVEVDTGYVRSWQDLLPD